ncbi:MAG: phage holin family protein [Bacteroidota bacterium]
MSFIINLLINAAILFVAAYMMPKITIKNFGTAIVAALLIGILNATVGFFLRLPLDLVTLFMLRFVVRLLVTAVVIKLVDKLMSGFEVQGFVPALVLALIMAIAGSFTDRTHSNRRYSETNTTVVQPLAEAIR